MWVFWLIHQSCGKTDFNAVSKEQNSGGAQLCESVNPERKQSPGTTVASISLEKLIGRVVNPHPHLCCDLLCLYVC